MEIGFIGLGRMGGNMAQRLLKAGHTVFGADRSEEMRSVAQKEGVRVFESATEMARAYTGSPRVFWAMVPAGRITDLVLAEIAQVAQPGDVVIDGGNSNYKDSVRHGEELGAKGIHFVDCGTSGGVWGLQNGYCLMVGAAPEAFAVLEPILRDLAPP